MPPPFRPANARTYPYCPACNAVYMNHCSDFTHCGGPIWSANDPCPPSATGLLVVSFVTVALLAYAGWVCVVLGVLMWH